MCESWSSNWTDFLSLFTVWLLRWIAVLALWGNGWFFCFNSAPLPPAACQDELWTNSQSPGVPNKMPDWLADSSDFKRWFTSPPHMNLSQQNEWSFPTSSLKLSWGEHSFYCQSWQCCVIDWFLNVPGGPAAAAAAQVASTGPAAANISVDWRTVDVCQVSRGQLLGGWLYWYAADSELGTRGSWECRLLAPVVFTQLQCGGIQCRRRVFYEKNCQSTQGCHPPLLGRWVQTASPCSNNLSRGSLPVISHVSWEFE